MRVQSEGQNWSHGSGAAEVGTKEWADYVRLQLVGMVDHLGEHEESFLGFVELVREHRAWTLMTKKDGETFRTIEEFCSYKRPWGLGTTWAQLRPHLVSGMAKRGKSQEEIERALQLETVPEPSGPKAGPGRGKKSESKTVGNECPRFSDRSTKQLRAINRAPDAVKDAYREGRISQTLAAKLGPKNPTPEKASLIASIAADVRRTRDRKEVDRLVREKLGARQPDAVERVVKLVERMQAKDRLELRQALEPLFLDAAEELRKRN